MCFLLQLYFFNYCFLLLSMMFSIHYYHFEAGTVSSFQALRQAQFFYLYQIASICVFYVYSISALQWLCNADKKGHNPAKRLYKFFSSLYSALVTFWTHFYYILCVVVSNSNICFQQFCLVTLVTLWQLLFQIINIRYLCLHCR